MLNPRAFIHLLFPESIRSTLTGATGSGCSVTYDCFLFSAYLHTLFPGRVTATNGFLIRLQLSHLLKPLYIPHSSFFLDSSTQLLLLPPSYFSSYSAALNFVLYTLSHLSVPDSNPDPLARLIFSFANCHHLSATKSLVPLYISFTSTTVLRNHIEAADWVYGGAPESQVVRTLRMTFESLRRLKDESFDGSCLMKSCCKEEEEEKCMVCLEGFEEETNTKCSVSQLSCSHVFHFRCVSQWLSLDHRCPVCRSPMPWVHAFFPDADVDARSSFSHNSTATSYLDLDDDVDNDDDESNNFVDNPC
ncbi:unnamed protein product [Citrullus colocynthis]|uniref:RING-type domain-containing protein n=1 Tax=Citrullus colocynthis TaxID=252529 RepID=A0ABP0XZF8_9ROSI